MPKVFANRWRVVKDLVPGGQAWTYVVENIETPDGAQYVLKRLKNLERIKRFEQEIAAVRSLDHPHIIRLVDSEVEGETPFLVSEYCSGGELNATQLENKSVMERLLLFSTIAVAIAHAHERGVIHRDIKPSNILFRDNGMAVVADFGICINTDHGLERVTEFQEQVGARFYMAPELADGRLQDVTPAADVYSLGKLLYWMFAGRIFDREKHMSNAWDLRTESSDPALLTIYDQLFSKTIVEVPETRFANATELWKTTQGVIETMQKQGRYLDADVPTDCLFCGVGKYSEKQIVPNVKAMAFNPQMGRVAEYEVDYNNLYGLGYHQPNRLPAGNIESGQYISFLILKCRNCGNLQFFQLDSNSTSWKNARPVV